MTPLDFCAYARFVAFSGRTVLIVQGKPNILFIMVGSGSLGGRVVLDRNRPRPIHKE